MQGLAEKRKEQGISLARMAKELGLAFHTYCNYEYGKREPKIETLLKMAQYFNCHVEELF